MKKYRLQIGLDVDDILYDCNAYALQLLNEEQGSALTIQDIRSWGDGTGVADGRLRYFGRPEFVQSQPVFEGASYVRWRTCSSFPPCRPRA